MEMEKKNLAIIILAVVLALSGIGNVVLGVMTGFIEVGEEKVNTIIVGYGSNPAKLDPVNTWDVPSNNLQQQVCEGLVKYNLSNYPEYELIPALATNWKRHNATHYSFKLRKDVYFHDDTKFNAEAAVWNFKRLMHFCNYTGDLIANETASLAFPASLYFFPNGSKLFKDVKVNSEYNFSIYLTDRFDTLPDLLTFSATYMLSPSSTPFYRYLNLRKDKLVGTGPFKWVRFKQDVDFRFERWGRYYKTGPWAEKLIFRVIEDDVARMNTGLAGKFDYIGAVPKTYISQFEADSTFNVEYVGQDSCYFYLEIYSGPPLNVSSGEPEPTIMGGEINQKWSPDFRRAVLLSINYTYIEDEIQQGYAFPGTCGVPRIMGEGYNETVGGDIITGEGGLMPNHFPFGDYFDSVQKAREYMLNHETYGPLINAEGIYVAERPDDNTTANTMWAAMANLADPALNFTLQLNEHYGSLTHQKMNVLFQSNLKYIGVASEITIRDWDTYLDTGQYSPWEMDLGYIGWCPDYLDPGNMLDPIFNNKSGACFSRISDPYLLELLERAPTEALVDKMNTYKEIQSLIFDVTRPVNPASACHGSGWVDLVQQVHKTALKGIVYNVLQVYDCWNWYKE